ncbi:hypothetical protein PS706_05901 [Pseudomonas fluorescens]|nr:hypothetical protein PS706_05901 [Pseudomonas fluorescens]
MLHQDQYMFISGDAQQGNPQQRSLFQIEGLGDFGLDPRLELRFMHLGVRYLQRHLRRNYLNRAVALLAQMGAQAFMPCQQGIETALQCAQVKLPFQTQGAGDVVRGALWLQLPQKPLALLGVGQRQRLVPPYRQQRGRGRCVWVLGCQCGDKPLQARLFEQQLERHFELQCLTNARDHLHGQQ